MELADRIIVRILPSLPILLVFLLVGGGCTCRSGTGAELLVTAWNTESRNGHGSVERLHEDGRRLGTVTIDQLIQPTGIRVVDSGHFFVGHGGGHQLRHVDPQSGRATSHVDGKAIGCTYILGIAGSGSLGSDFYVTCQGTIPNPSNPTDPNGIPGKLFRVRGEDNEVHGRALLTTDDKDLLGGIACGPEGLLYFGITFKEEPENRSLIKTYDPDTGEFATFADEDLNLPTDLAFDTHGVLYVANRMGNDVTRYDRSGKKLGAPGVGKIQEPTGLAFGPNGDLWVASRSGNEVIRFNLAAKSVVTRIEVQEPFGVEFVPPPEVHPCR